MVHPEEGGRSPGEKPIDFAALNPGHVSLFVTAGLDPAVHSEPPHTRNGRMDARVKPTAVRFMYFRS